MSVNPKNLSQPMELDVTQGQIALCGNRMLLFNAEALGCLRQELVQSLGMDLARGVLTRFGFSCGYCDFVNTQRFLGLAADDPELILGGPQIHTVEGLVLADCQELRFDHKKGTFLMRGTWRNSYEVEQHLRLFGMGDMPVCWTGAGYASGYASGFMGARIVAVERRCMGKGDPYCEYELRPAAHWGPEAKDYIAALEPVTVVKSMQRMIREEKKRVLQWRALSEAAAEVLQLSSLEELAGKFIRYALKLLEVEQAVLVVQVTGSGGKEYLVYKMAGADITSQKLAGLDGTLEQLYHTDKVIVEGDRRHWRGLRLFPEGKAAGYLALPLRDRQGTRGILIVSDDRPMLSEDRELLVIFASQLSIALANVMLYTQTDAQLREKVTQLNALAQELSNRHRDLQRSVAIHDELTALVLEGKGVKAITRTLAHIIGNPVRIEHINGRRVHEAFPDDQMNEVSFVPVQSLLVSAEPGVLAALLKDKQGVGFPGPEIGGRQITQMVLPIVVGEEVLGFISALPVTRPLVDLDVIAMEHGSTVVALELLKERAAKETELRLKHDFVEQLLSGRFISEEAMISQALAFGLDLNQPWRVLLLELDGQVGEGLRRWHERLSALLFERLDAVLVAGQEERLIILAQVTRQPVRALIKELEAKLSEILGDTLFWLAVGPEGKSARECGNSYQEAQAMMQVLKALGKCKRVLLHEDLTVFGLLQIDKERFARFSKKVLGPLLDHDSKYRSQLLETIRLYFEHSGNVQQAAKSSFLSPGTMRYRLRRIREISGLDLDDPGTSLQVQLALKIIL